MNDKKEKKKEPEKNTHRNQTPAARGLSGVDATMRRVPCMRFSPGASSWKGNGAADGTGKDMVFICTYLDVKGIKPLPNFY